MYPYKDLPEHVKEYDRVTVRSVLKAIKESGYELKSYSCVDVNEFYED